MFYCESCRQKKEWPKSENWSYGECDVCDLVDDCYEVRDELLPKDANSRLFKVGNTISVDIETGEETLVEGRGFRMLPGPPGSCTWCCVVHEPEMAHNRDSLAYQIRFQAIHGRSPTWTDAMAHCTPLNKSFIRIALIDQMNKHNLDIPEDLQ